MLNRMVSLILVLTHFSLRKMEIKITILYIIYSNIIHIKSFHFSQEKNILGPKLMISFDSATKYCKYIQNIFSIGI